MEKFYNVPSLNQALFGVNIDLLPSVTELFEYELAYLEIKKFRYNPVRNPIS